MGPTRPLLSAERAAGHDDARVGALEQHHRRRQRLGDDDEALALQQLERQVVRGARRVERDDVTVVDESRRLGRDGALRRGLAVQAIPERALVAALGEHGAAARAAQQLPPLERVEILTDRHL